MRKKDVRFTFHETDNFSLKDHDIYVLRNGIPCAKFRTGRLRENPGQTERNFNFVNMCISYRLISFYSYLVLVYPHEW